MMMVPKNDKIVKGISKILSNNDGTQLSIDSIAQKLHCKKTLQKIIFSLRLVANIT